MDRACYSDPMWITGVAAPHGCRVCNAARVLAATQLPACLCRQPTWKLRVLSTRDKSYSTGERAPFISLAPDAGELLRQQNSSWSLSFRATRTPLHLRQGLSNRLHPLVQALIIPSPDYSRSSSTPAASTAVESPLWPDRSSVPSLLPGASACSR